MQAAALESHLAALDRDGYTILEDAIDPELVAGVLARVREIEAETLGETELGSPVDGYSQLRTAGVLRLDPMFRGIAIHPDVLEIIEGLLGRTSC